jgi:hypothetical protein
MRWTGNIARIGAVTDFGNIKAQFINAELTATG